MTDQGELTADEVLAVHAVVAEYLSASRKHPKFNSAHEGYAVILEEMDELKDEVWKRHHDAELMRKEAVQVAAMALRFLTDVCS
jgi:molybdopterin biosynthesis enzyme